MSSTKEERVVNGGFRHHKIDLGTCVLESVQTHEPHETIPNGEALAAGVDARTQHLSAFVEVELEKICYESIGTTKPWRLGRYATAVYDRVRCLIDSWKSFNARHSVASARCGLGVLSVAYAVYFICAMLHSFGDEGSIRLLWITCVVVLCLSVTTLKAVFTTYLVKNKSGDRLFDMLARRGDLINW